MIRARDVAVAQDRLLSHIEGENGFSIRPDRTGRGDILELAGGVEILDGALEDARAQRNSWRDPRVAAEHRLGDSLIATEYHAVWRCARSSDWNVAASLLRPGRG